jgi:3-hydroxyacyl-CoA dehydrogenase
MPLAASGANSPATVGAICACEPILTGRHDNRSALRDASIRGDLAVTPAVNAAVTLSEQGAILIAEIDNPPVNALSHAVRQGLFAALDRLEADAALSGMVIAARGATFCAGADVSEFGAPMQAPQLGAVIARLDASAKPVVAAIQGPALGGGLELALACNARVALAGARLGLPEVKLGILPGSGGIVRLPRLIGVAAAIEMIAEGKPVDAARALTLGLIDQVADSDPLAAAVAFAGELGASGEAPRRVSASPFPVFDADAQNEARKALARKYRGREAPLKAVELFAMAAGTPFAEAAEREYAACKALLSSPQSRALRHLFAAERAAARPAAIPARAAPREIGRAGVAGAGAMGRGVAIALLDAGLPVALVARSDASAAAARLAIEKTYDSGVKRGATTEAQKAERLARLTTSTTTAALGDADIVVETISEDLAAKREIIAAIDHAVGETAVLVTNTSFLDIERLAEATTRPQNFAGMHFFNPAHLMKLVEVVRTARTGQDALATLMALTKRLGKIAVLVGPSEGFVANRMLSKRTREALFLLQDGAAPAQVDRVLSGFGFPVGPFTLADMAGLDVLAATRLARAASMTDREREADIIETLVEAGRLGRKSGAGYYAYGDDGKPTDDPAVADLLDAHRRKRGVAPRAISDDEVLERCLLALVNEGANLIDEGAVERAGDIDVIWTAGLGFPAHLGGPMFWAAEQGLPAIRHRLDHYAQRVGAEFFAPSPLIARHAATGAPFR